MITTNFLDSMYDKFIDSRELTTKELLSIGFTSKDLTRLKEKGKIASVKRGVYRLVDIDGLFSYSYTQSKNRRYDGLKKCLEMDPENTKYLLGVFNQSLWVKDFDTTFKCIDILNNPDYRKYQNLRLLLLSYITDLGEKYRERVRNLTLDDITFDYSSIQMNTSIYDANFREVLSIAKNLKKEGINNLILWKLISLAEKKHKKKLALYHRLIDHRDYEQLLEELSREKEIHPLGIFERNALLIAQDIISMKENGHIRNVDFSDTDDFDVAVRKGNYDLALKLSQTIYFSLNRTDLEQMLAEALYYKRNLKEKKQLSEDLDFSYYLTNGEFDQAFDSLDKYLLVIGQEKYHKYICLLTKLSVLDNDSSFEEPIYAYKSIVAGNFELDCSAYIMDFFYALNNNDVKKASVYLDIVFNSEAFGGDFVDTSHMRESLDKKISELGIENTSSEDISEEAVSLGMPTFVSTCEMAGSKRVPLQTVIDGVINGDNLALLEPMNDEDISNVLREIGDDINIIPFVIGDGNEKQIALKYQGFLSGFSITRTLQEAEAAYFGGEFDSCIHLYESLLPCFSEPKSFIYVRLGRAYYNRAENDDWNHAIDYLTLANASGKKENWSYDYTELVNRLKTSTGYNGIRVTLDSKKDKDDTVRSDAIQYVKKDNKK